MLCVDIRTANGSCDALSRFDRQTCYEVELRDSDGKWHIFYVRLMSALRSTLASVFREAGRRLRAVNADQVLKLNVKRGLRVVVAVIQGMSALSKSPSLAGYR